MVVERVKRRYRVNINDKRKWTLIFILLILLFIWSQSTVPESRSAYESGWLTNKIITPILKTIGISPIDKHAVRKIAHIVEYLVLNVFVSAFWNGKPVRSIYTGFTVAFLDESIQVIADRGALITDLWVDLIGIVAGTAIGYLIYKFKRFKHQTLN